MKIKRFTKVILAFCLSVGIFFATVVPVQATPIAESAGYVAMMVDANVLGAGVLYGPVRVRFYEGESAMDITARFLGNNAEILTSEWGDFLNGIRLPHNFRVNVPQVVVDEIGDLHSGATRRGRLLQASDFAETSGWMLTVNDEMSMLGASGEFPQNGDVIRWEFSLNFGNDLGFEDWEGNPGLIERVDRSELIAAVMRPCNPSRANITWSMTTLGNLLATQDEIDDVALTLMMCVSPAFWWSNLPAWLQWILRYILFGWIWM